MTYGVGLLDEMGWDSFDKVVFEIIGMRWANSTWECSVQTLKDFKHDVMLPAFVAAHSINPKATTGDHCRYCIAKIHCKEWLTEFSEYDNESFSYEDIHDMPTEEAEELFYRLKQAEALRKQLSDELLERFDGFDPPKRVTRVAPSAIIKYSVSEDELIDALADKLGDVNDLYNQKLKTPKELIKLLGDDALKELTMEQWRKPYIRS